MWVDLRAELKAGLSVELKAVVKVVHWAERWVFLTAVLTESQSVGPWAGSLGQWWACYWAEPKGCP